MNSSSSGPMVARRLSIQLVRANLFLVNACQSLRDVLAPTTGAGRWAETYSRAVALVAQMTNEEKENTTYGYASTTNGCSGNSGGVPRLNFPGLCLNDAGNGVRGADLVNGYPAGLHVGAAWNRKLAYNRAQFMGAEFKAKGGISA